MKDKETSETPAVGRDQRISAIAYQIWEEEGRPEGRSEVHWYLACEMVDAEDAAEEPLPTWLSKQAEEAKPASPAPLMEARKKSAA